MENFIYARSFRDLLVYKQAFIVSRKISTYQKVSRRMRNTLSRVRSEERHDQLVPTLRRLGRSEGYRKA
jgi:hypothetical protein